MHHIIIKLKNDTTLIAKVQEVNYDKDDFGFTNITCGVNSFGMLHLFNPKVLPQMTDWIPEMKTINGEYIIPIIDDNILTVGEPDEKALLDYLTGEILEESE
jgi:hypothetical protein